MSPGEVVDEDMCKSARRPVRRGHSGRRLRPQLYGGSSGADWPDDSHATVSASTRRGMGWGDAAHRDCGRHRAGPRSWQPRHVAGMRLSIVLGETNFSSLSITQDGRELEARLASAGTGLACTYTRASGLERDAGVGSESCSTALTLRCPNGDVVEFGIRELDHHGDNRCTRARHEHQQWKSGVHLQRRGGQLPTSRAW